MYPVFISLYEATVDAYNQLMSNAPQEVKNVILYSKSNVFAEYDDVKVSIEAFLYQFRLFYIEYLSEYPIDDEYAIMAWNTYQGCNLREYMSALLPFYASAYADKSQLTLDIVKKAMSDFKQLTDTEQILFIRMDGYGEFIYYNTLREFFETTFGKDSKALELANALLDIEVGLVEELTADDFVKAWEKIEADYGELGDEQAKFDECLKDTYDYYKALYDEVKAERAE